MIDLKKLIDFLPFEYKDQDTYKVDGKGILERFLEICGSYFQDNICLLYTSPSPRDGATNRMPSSA